ncbi:MAG: hypothetical protein M3291_06180, partial [Actinomycetota bacterium]|nr:hypothetical protein [Actinomycetota bacterium]
SSVRCVVRRGTRTELDREPFFAAVRRRHPDVDIVLLRGEPDADPADPMARRGEPEIVDVAEARRRRAEAEALLDDLLELLTPGLDQAADAPVSAWRGSGPGEVVAETSMRIPEVGAAAGHEALETAAANLLVRGWRVDRPEGGAPRIVARHDQTSVQVTWWPPVAAYDVAVRTDPVRVGVEAARELKAQDRA